MTQAPTTISRLSVWDVVSLIVGIIVGASIFRSAGDTYGNIVDRGPIPAWLVGMGMWTFIGVLTFVGALCYAELATTYPTSGGDYVFITRAYGRPLGFLFAWSEMSIIRTGGSISAMAYVFGDFANRIFHLGNNAPYYLAIVAILTLGIVNALGVQPGKWAQNVLTVLKVIGLVAIVLAGFLYFLWPRTAADVVTASEPVVSYPPSLAVAAVFIFYAYGGWNDAGYVAAELGDRRRDILRALMIGVAIVVAVYLAINAAYLMALGIEPLRRSQLAAADLMTLPLGEFGARLISVLIMISALGAINGLLFTGMRLYSRFGESERLFAGLARRRNNVPLGALAVQIMFSIGLMTLFETGVVWKPWLAGLLGRVGIAVPESFVRPAGGFGDVVAATAPVFWLFFLLTAVSLPVLRWREPQTPRPFRVPLYPLTPLLFVGACLFMLYQSTAYALTLGPGELLTVAAFVLLGIPLLFLSRPIARN